MKDHVLKDVVAQGGGRSSKEGPTEAEGTPWGVLVRSTKGGEPKIDASNGPPSPEGTRRNGHVSGARERRPKEGWDTPGGATPDPDVGGVAAGSGRTCTCLPLGGG